MRSSTFSISWSPEMIIKVELEHSQPRRTQSTRRRGVPARGPEEKCRPPHPSSRRTACRWGLDHATILTVEPKPLITLTLTPTKRIDGPVGSAFCCRWGVAQNRFPSGRRGAVDLHHAQAPDVLDHSKHLAARWWLRGTKKMLRGREVQHRDKTLVSDWLDDKPLQNGSSTLHRQA